MGPKRTQARRWQKPALVGLMMLRRAAIADNNYRWFAVRSFPIRNSGGKLERWLTIAWQARRQALSSNLNKPGEYYD